ncbi:hypothetical protein DF117_35070 [Burkholderia stagnalis]|nr:hypothetical protein DF117_35070 [Burkholderia stagnalis]
MPLHGPLEVTAARRFPARHHQHAGPADAGVPAKFAAATDALVDAMQPARLAFNVPSPINLDDTREIVLKIDLHQSRSELEAAVSATAEGTPVSDTVAVSERMTAHLTGDDFTVTPIAPETQNISGHGTTTWVWEVKPKTWGPLQLRLTLDAELGAASAGNHRFAQTYGKAIEVKVWPVHWRRIQDFVEHNWQWLWTVLVPVGLWLYHKRKGKPDDTVGI